MLDDFNKKALESAARLKQAAENNTKQSVRTTLDEDKIAHRTDALTESIIRVVLLKQQAQGKDRNA